LKNLKTVILTALQRRLNRCCQSESARHAPVSLRRRPRHCAEATDSSSGGITERIQVLVPQQKTYGPGGNHRGRGV